MLLPQAPCGAAAVGVLHATVRPTLGHRAALPAALALAVSPVSIAVARVNNPDALLVLLLALSAHLVARAIESDPDPGAGGATVADAANHPRSAPRRRPSRVPAAASAAARRPPRRADRAAGAGPGARAGLLTPTGDQGTRPAGTPDPRAHPPELHPPVSATPQFAGESDGGGRFVRQDSRFRERVDERPEPGRYHLYVSLACPWASRAVIVRMLKGLQEDLPMTVLDPIRDDRGWRFDPQRPDPVNGFAFLQEAYEATEPGFDARVTVPVLWDTQEGRIVNNESADIIRMLDGWSDDGPDLVPEDLRHAIDELNERIYATVNNGVYAAGFASTQEAYEEAFDELFATLDWLDDLLATRRFLLGDQITEADWRLFVTLVRFDAVYVGHFKCNLRRIEDYDHLSGYLRDLYQQPGVADTVDFDHIKRHYYGTHPQINPTGIVPKGPALDLWRDHGRETV
ncbi:glutathione S-transferase family protein [Baekduia soli]|uniref:Glutathione S-transferase family protein n=1 Tax=Baekduia soli TaxID=496014 RepID=A0A5B8U3L0_9ACTN|nr:glutathione S-transferase family protein [Baekduia soli]QEC47445.1 glutathione S-transferase family protein [Baekduia soli]